MLKTLWRLYWEEYLKYLTMEDYEWRIDHLNTLLEEFCHEFDDIHSIQKKESKREGT